jgi:hypothetical protein
MGRKANFPTNFLTAVNIAPGGVGIVVDQVDPVFGIGHLLVTHSFLQISDIILEVRFTPFPTSTDSFFFLQTITAGTVTLLTGFTLFDSVGGILEVDIIDVSFGVARTISVQILFDFNLPVQIPQPGSLASQNNPNPSGQPGGWIII